MNFTSTLYFDADKLYSTDKKKVFYCLYDLFAKLLIEIFGKCLGNAR